MNVLVTGATGFVGKCLVTRLAAEEGIEVSAAVRREAFDLPVGVRIVKADDLGADTDWGTALENIQVVIHTAARVHVMKESVDDPLIEYRKVNLAGTLNLAQRAVTANVERFIFISTVKVNGELTAQGRPFKEDDQPTPEDPYAISKWETEIGLQQLAKESGIEVVIIRPPLVYGPGVKANFLSMMRWIDRGLPLPLGTIHNKRSMVALDNLVDLIITCVDHPAAANQTFLVGDGEDLSITELLQRMGKALGKKARLFPFPVSLLNLAASLLGKKDVSQRLLGSLQVDISKTQKLLDWKPQISVEEGLEKVAKSFTNG